MSGGPTSVTPHELQLDPKPLHAYVPRAKRNNERRLLCCIILARSCASPRVDSLEWEPQVALVFTYKSSEPWRLFSALKRICVAGTDHNNHNKSLSESLAVCFRSSVKRPSIDVRLAVIDSVAQPKDLCHYALFRPEIGITHVRNSCQVY